METNVLYAVEDWVVHKLYGVGQIKGVESRPINGETTPCFKVKTKDCTYWFPVNGDENPRIRPVSSEEIIAKAIQTLRRKPRYLDTDRKFWKEKIAEAQQDGNLIAASKVIRGLSAQRVFRKLNQSEEKALDRFKERLVREWSAIQQVEAAELRQQLHDCIQESKNKIKVME